MRLLWHNLPFVCYRSPQCSLLSTSVVVSPKLDVVVTPKDLYERRIAARELSADPFQQKILESFQTLHRRATRYIEKEESLNESLFQQIIFGVRKQLRAPRGIYLYGSVGVGKTMLMDLFHHCVDSDRKLRIHFHDFMLYVHKEIHQLKMASESTKQFDPIPQMAKQIRAKALLLCFDEFQVTDIADAMILKRLFTELFEKGVIVVATSNRRPEDLYLHGIMRSNFVPFIDVLKHYCESISLDSHKDYRRLSITPNSSLKTYFLASDEGTDLNLRAIHRQLISKESDTVRPRFLTVFGRSLKVETACGGVLDITFTDLCTKALGSADYIVFSQCFHTIVLRNVPLISGSDLAAARRFITAIDAFYNYKVRLIISAAAPPDKLFVIEDFIHHETPNNEPNSPVEMIVDNNASGAEEKFAFDRTISRLFEMQSDEYWKHRQPTYETRPSS